MPTDSRYPVRRTDRVRLLVCLGLAAALISCRSRNEPDHGPRDANGKNEKSTEKAFTDLPITPKHGQQPAPNGSRDCPRFREVAGDLGVRFHYDNGAVGKALMVESTGGGVAWIDFDCDGRPDLYFVQGGNPTPQPGEKLPTNQLHRNIDGKRFEERTAASRLGDSGYGQGVGVGDYDNDGFDDVYVTNVGGNVLFRNMGDGTFENVTSEAGVDDKRWSSSAAWGDLDGDGDLDLFVCNYLKYDPWKPVPCPKDDGTPGICHPNALPPAPNACFENLGDGTFRPVAAEWGLQGEGSKSLGVVIADFNRDGKADVYVANDTTGNFLFMNRGNKRFEESAVSLGAAMSGGGSFQASMGIGFGDFDHNGYQDLYITHFTSDSNTLYANLGAAGFQDVTQQTGLRSHTLKYLGFGTVMCDFDANGRQDLFITNGHIDDWRERGELWKMPAQLFTFGGRRWKECSQRAGAIFRKNVLGRGVATGDFDGDGAIDVAVVHQNEQAAVLRNESKRGGWIHVRLIGRASNRNAIGTEVTLRQGQRTLVGQLAGGTSYCAAHQRLIPFGLGNDRSRCQLTILWPSGRRQEFPNVEPNRVVTAVEPNGPTD